MVWTSLEATYWMPNSLDSSVNELRSNMFTEIPGPSTLGSYNVHNVLAGSNILIWVCFVGLAVFLNPKPK